METGEIYRDGEVIEILYDVINGSGLEKVKNEDVFIFIDAFQAAQ